MYDVKGLSLVELFDLAWRRIRDELAADPVTEAPELRPSQLRVLGRTPLEGIRVTALADRTLMTAQALGTIVDVLVRPAMARTPVNACHPVPVRPGPATGSPVSRAPVALTWTAI